MPPDSRPRECGLAIPGVWLVGIDTLLFQKHFYNLLMPFSGRPRKSRTPHAIGPINIPFLHLRYTKLSPLLREMMLPIQGPVGAMLSHHDVRYENWRYLVRTS